ncbi:tail fiber protein [Algibacter sp. AS12]|uniref:phage tail protein n=1 Tax=Algibacter sp. AS12 TaxID=3135773 RepID=UPI00398AE431
MKKQIILSCIIVLTFLGTNTIQAQTPYTGQIKMFAGNFAPRGWAFCDGQLLAISQNDALFSLLGTTYGGDGRTTFGLPDLRGRVPVSQGQGPGLSDLRLGIRFGVEQVTLTQNEMPAHNHATNTTAQIAVSTVTGTELNADANVLANHTNAYNSGSTAGANLAGANTTTTLGTVGGNLSHNNIQPSLGVHYIIALYGIYPSRN